MKGFAFPVEIIRTDRKKTVSIYLDDSVVRLRVPRTLSEKRIREIIGKRTPWILTKLKAAAEMPIVRAKEFVSGESFPYLERNYRLKVLVGDKPSVDLKYGYLRATVCKTDRTPQETVRAMLINWYKEQARIRLNEKTQRFAGIIGVEPRSVTVKDYKSKWGSCSIRSDICYNWRIVQAPHSIVDYVVVHELCHILEHNHSSRFWKHVERYVPDYKDLRNWLKNQQLTF